MDRMNAAAAWGLSAFESQVKARAEFRADHGFHPVEDVWQIVNLVGGAAPILRIGGELD